MGTEVVDILRVLIVQSLRRHVKKLGSLWVIEASFRFPVGDVIDLIDLQL